MRRAITNRSLSAPPVRDSPPRRTRHSSRCGKKEGKTRQRRGEAQDPLLKPAAQCRGRGCRKDRPSPPPQRRDAREVLGADVCVLGVKLRACHEELLAQDRLAGREDAVDGPLDLRKVAVGGRRRHGDRPGRGTCFRRDFPRGLGTTRGSRGQLQGDNANDRLERAERGMK